MRLKFNAPDYTEVSYVQAKLSAIVHANAVGKGEAGHGDLQFVSRFHVRSKQHSDMKHYGVRRIMRK